MSNYDVDFKLRLPIYDQPDWKYSRLTGNTKIWNPVRVTLSGEIDAYDWLERHQQNCKDNTSIYPYSNGRKVISVIRLGSDGFSYGWTLFHCFPLKILKGVEQHVLLHINYGERIAPLGGYQ